MSSAHIPMRDRTYILASKNHLSWSAHLWLSRIFFIYSKASTYDHMSRGPRLKMFTVHDRRRAMDMIQGPA